ncbi:hypothetical protein [Galbibacter mesophilus]|uniref:hypothetical protein n=1 Tax=Galbibacter mesophilus TaxID=379069 RepID=UPI001F5DF056|nr:hypothetical protein [Galbibacter mesophilus]MCM5664086.1 hypothetical protein [Galbibacter mesophilus]
MKNVILAGLFVLCAMGLHAQDATTVKEGDVFEVASPSGQEFRHINFPKKNFIIKRGGVASDKLVYGEKVVVTKVSTKKDGSTEIQIKPVDGGRFYNAIPSVSVDYEQAMETGELRS